jgi:excisionase family DNA binding protein
MNEIMTIAEFADEFRFNIKTVYRWAAEGTIPARKFGDDWRLFRSELMASGVPEVPAPRRRREPKPPAQRAAKRAVRPASRPGRRPAPAKVGSVREQLQTLNPYADLRAT